ncbi:O-antigen ligase family protein [Ramlibacter sp. MMS24-I3-19]|uniref:O-antigen ligase family protein n=1 Tax=Ramlibacter sp. MMS24-I3-19 TaxID=3416606 RepID=UPI003D046EB7
MNRSTHKSAPSGGFLYWMFPAMLAVGGLGVLLSNRDLTQAFQHLEETAQSIADPVQNPIVMWVQRAVSLLLVAGALERLASHFGQRRPVPSIALTGAFLFFWLTTVLTPGLLGAHPVLTHEYVYSLLFGLAVTMTIPEDRERILRASRDGLFVFMLAGLVLIPWNPVLVLDSSYSQGLLPGVPRFGGLSAHPVMMGILCQTALLLLWARPYERRWLTVCAWVLGLGVLFFAQSKTAWLAFLISASCMVLVRKAPGSVERLADPRANSFGVLLLLGVMAAAIVVLVGVVVFDVPSMVQDFFGTSEGAQLASLTGRDRIWVVALDEWHNNPVFGYGPTIWDNEYRQAIGMPNATHGHNQMIDTLARCGTVGAVGLVVYAIVLMVMAIRYARATQGLSLAMFLTLALLSVSEVPLLLVGYGMDVFAHMLLLVTLAGAAAEQRRPHVALDPIEPTLRTAS